MLKFEGWRFQNWGKRWGGEKNNQAQKPKLAIFPKARKGPWAGPHMAPFASFTGEERRGSRQDGMGFPSLFISACRQVGSLL